MSAGVHTPELRFRFVEKSLSEVGDGTIFPMEVTRDQLAEIMYRVRDARWESGYSTQTVNVTNYEPPEEDNFFTSILSFTADSPDTEKVQWWIDYTDSAYTRRGFVTTADLVSPAVPMDEYSVTYFSETAYLDVGGTAGIGSSHSMAYREAIQERALWANAFADVDSTKQSHYLAEEAVDDFHPNPQDEFKTGFSIISSSWIEGDRVLPPPIYCAYNSFEDSAFPGFFPYYGARVHLIFSGDVAWVDDDESGNPFSGGNRLFIGVDFSIYNSFETALGPAFSTNLGSMGSASSKLADLKLKLSGTDNYITAAIYGNTDSGWGTNTPTSTDWIFEATEWWPYAKDSPAVPVWDTGTGLKNN